jgi:two-component system, LuxR family, response regulator FixJ
LESVRAGGGVAQSPPKVFVVCDDRDGRESLVSMLTAFHFAVATFESPKLFLEQYRKDTPGCLLLELTAPGANEVGLLEELRERGLMLPAVVISHSMEIPAVVRAMQLGTLHLMQSPYDSVALRKWLEQGIFLDVRRRRKESLQQEFRQKLGSLTREENQVLGGILSGWHNKVIAARLDIGVRTAQARRSVLMKKLNCNSVSELVWKVVVARLDNSDALEWHEFGTDFPHELAKLLETNREHVGKQ